MRIGVLLQAVRPIAPRPKFRLDLRDAGQHDGRSVFAGGKAFLHPVLFLCVPGGYLKLRG